MCLIVDAESPLIADKDITCYKVVNCFMRSPVMRFQYKTGRTYTSKINMRPGVYHNHFVIQEALHTFSTIDRLKDCFTVLYPGVAYFRTRTLAEKALEILKRELEALNIK